MLNVNYFRNSKFFSPKGNHGLSLLFCKTIAWYRSRIITITLHSDIYSINSVLNRKKAILFWFNKNVWRHILSSIRLMKYNKYIHYNRLNLSFLIRKRYGIFSMNCAVHPVNIVNCIMNKISKDWKLLSKILSSTTYNGNLQDRTHIIKQTYTQI